jgi:hypothetical protein
MIYREKDLVNLPRRDASCNSIALALIFIPISSFLLRTFLYLQTGDCWGQFNIEYIMAQTGRERWDDDIIIEIWKGLSDRI